jgi:hypothetical protein
LRPQIFVLNYSTTEKSLSEITLPKQMSHFTHNKNGVLFEIHAISLSNFTLQISCLAPNLLDLSARPKRRKEQLRQMQLKKKYFYWA